MRLYEGMFIIDSTIANSDWDSVASGVHDLLKNRGAEIIRSEKWDERKLAFKIKDYKRGTYFLVYFNAPQDSITNINRDLQLSDIVMRSLIVKIDKIKEPMPRVEEPQVDEKEDVVDLKVEEVVATEVSEEKPVPVASE